MNILTNLVSLTGGSPQFRIRETADPAAPQYRCYTESALSDNLSGLVPPGRAHRLLRTFDQVKTLAGGDIVFSLISGRSAQVRQENSGSLYTQNYVRLSGLSPQCDPAYLVYLLNEHPAIRRQSKPACKARRC